MKLINAYYRQTRNSDLLIYLAIDDREEIRLLNKTTDKDSRSRAMIILEISLKIPECWLEKILECSRYPGLVFSYHGKPIANYYDRSILQELLTALSGVKQSVEQ